MCLLRFRLMGMGHTGGIKEIGNYVQIDFHLLLAQRKHKKASTALATEAIINHF